MDNTSPTSHGDDTGSGEEIKTPVSPKHVQTFQNFMSSVHFQCQYMTFRTLHRCVATNIEQLGFRTISMRISAAIRLRYLDSLFMMPISTLDMLPPGQTAAIITITASNLQNGISEKLASLFTGAMTVVAASIVAFYDNWLLTVATSLGLVFIASIYSLTTPLINKQMAELHEANVSTSSVATEAFTSARMVAACGAEQKMIDKHATLVDRARKNGVAIARLLAGQHGLGRFHLQHELFFGVYSSFALAFWVAFQMYMLVAITSSESLIVSISQISAPVAAASQAADACAIFHTIIDSPQTTYGTCKSPEISMDGDIVFENVNFVYPSRPEVKVLDNLNLRIPAGKVTAIVGPSGSGKSTIVAILQRWYEFNGDVAANPIVLWLRNGQVSVSGRSLTDIDLKWWRTQVGLVQQESTLFDTTVFHNVAAGLIGTEWEHAQDEVKRALVAQACQDAYADEFITNLPDGYETSVGEFGMKLSGGQRQRLAIARAIIKRPKILILDEATSAIDVHSEKIVQEALDNACQGRTTIVIAHRLSTVQKAENIVVLQKGQIVEQGTHQELLARTDSQYYLLAMAQHLGVGINGHGQLPSGDSSDEKDVFSDKGNSDTFSNEKSQPTDHATSDHMGIGPGAYSPRSSFDDTRSLLEETNIAIAEQKQEAPDSFGVLLREQKSSFALYVVILCAAFGTGGEFIHGGSDNAWTNECCDAASTPLQAYIFSNLVALFSFWSRDLSYVVSQWCLAFLYLALGVGICYALLAWTTATLGFRIMRNYQKELFSCMMNKPAAFFDEHSVGALSARLATDPSQLHQLLGTNLASLLVSFFNLLGCVGISLAFGWKLTAVALGTSVPVIIAAMVYRVRLETRIEAKSNAVFAESAKFASESITSIRTVSSLNMEAQIYQRYQSLLRNHVRGAIVDLILPALLFSFCDNISLLCMGFVLWYGGQLLASHEYSPFQYMIVYIAVIQGGLNAGQWLSFASNIATAKAAADRVIDIRDGDNETLHEMMWRQASSDEFTPDVEKAVEVRFHQVWFSYAGRPMPVLKGLNIEIKRGEFVAFVGPSGSGKTTIISLLERFYAVQNGAIARNGLTISDTDLAVYRSSISLVAQESCLFSGSIRDNILLGVPDEAFIDEEELHRAARDAGIHEFIVSLPEGYDTEIGPRGVALSGGQKQRISIARALIRHPSLLLLDEATSSLDTATERAIQAVFDEMKGSRTMVVVAHRLSTVRNADVIFVMDDGRVVEQGNHSQLIEQSGIYTRMASLPNEP
ncbi:hypothetical protein S40288_05346 [Stachybotrys chartarum IBT 40288]|nr:hypothetical protein S40288_05346 [Stachybotrys chartarum IBT 40288]